MQRMLLRSLALLLVAMTLSAVAPADTGGVLEIPLEHKRTRDGVLFGRVYDRFTGTLDLNGQTYEVSMLSNQRGGGLLDGLLGRRASSSTDPPVPRDFVLKTAQDTGYRWRSMFPAKLLLQGTLYDVQFAGADMKLVLTPYSGELTPLKLAMNCERVLLRSLTGKETLLLYRPGVTPKIPAGDYRVPEYHALRKDGDANAWRIEYQDWRGGLRVTVGPDSESVLQFGEPLVAAASIDNGRIERVRQGATDSLRMDFTLKGQAGENVNLSRVTRDGSRRRPEPPEYEITTPEGTPVAKGRFEYG